MSHSYCNAQMDHGSNPYVVNIGQAALQNPGFRTAVWTGCHLQMTVTVKMGKCAEKEDELLMGKYVAAANL